MGALTFAFRVTIVVLNIIFMLLALALVIGGFIIKFGHEILRPALNDAMSKVESTVKGYFGQSSFSTNDLDLGSIVSAIALVMILTGCVLLAFGFIGCCGACYSFTTLLLIYVVILIVLLLAQIVCVFVIFVNPDLIKSNIKPGLEDSLEKYQGLNGTNLISLGWNFAMVEYDCCGVTNYADFKKKSTTWWAINSHVTPLACCDNLPSSNAQRDACAGATSSTSVTSLTNSNYNKGCLDAIWEKVITNNVPGFATGIAICFAAQVALIILTIWVYQNRGITSPLL